MGDWKQDGPVELEKVGEARSTASKRAKPVRAASSIT